MLTSIECIELVSVFMAICFAVVMIDCNRGNNSKMDLIAAFFMVIVSYVVIFQAIKALVCFRG